MAGAMCALMLAGSLAGCGASGNASAGASESIGDHAADISDLTIMMADSPYLMKEDNIKKMAA